MQVYAARVLTTTEPDLYPVGCFLYQRGLYTKLVACAVEEGLIADAVAAQEFVDGANAGAVVTCELVSYDLTEVVPQ